MSSDNDDTIPDHSPETTRATAVSVGKSDAGAADSSLQASQDAEHLRLLAVFHYVIAAITGLLSLFPVLHLTVGIAILMGAVDGGSDSPPAFFGWMFVATALAMILGGLAFAVAIAIAGRKLQRRTGYLYCLVIAGLECFFMPVGTVLGVFTILVLMRPSVKERFGVTPADFR